MTVAGVKPIFGGVRTGKSGYALESAKARGDSVSWSATGRQSQRGPLRLPVALLLKPTLAWRALFDEVVAMETALTQPLAAGRSHVARLASRDAAALDAVQVPEAAIATLAENLNDSLDAPLPWFVLCGLPGAAPYRFANMADAMLGYRGPWQWGGKWAARADNLLFWLSARVTAALQFAVAWRKPRRTAFKADVHCTPSPNGGWPKGAMAQLLGLMLSKQGACALPAGGRAAEPADTRRALAGGVGCRGNGLRRHRIGEGWLRK